MKFPTLTTIAAIGAIAIGIAIVLLLTSCANLPFGGLTIPVGDPPAALVRLQHNAPPDPIAGEVEIQLINGIPSDRLDFSLTEKGASVIIFREAQAAGGKAVVE